jgi:hypothetical protein
MDRKEEKLREMKILGVNIFLSIIISLISTSNLFNILSFNVPYDSFGWRFRVNPTFDVSTSLLTLIGCILTGLFISLGSKFWHDLLGLLLYAKDAKRALSDPNQYKLTNGDQIKTFTSYNAYDIAKTAKIQNADALSKTDGYIDCIADVITNEIGQTEPVLYVTLKGKVLPGFPEQKEVYLDKNITIKINVKPIQDLGIATLHIKNADSIGPFSDKDTGTVCCLVVNQDDIAKQFILTCGHVVTDDELLNLDEQNSINSVFIKGNDIGYVNKCIMGDGNDFALIAPKDSSNLITSGFNTFPKQLQDEDRGKFVKIMSNTGQKTGYISFLGFSQSFDLKNKKTLDFNNLIAISKTSDINNFETVTVPGDSGSAVLIGNILVGMIVGGDKRFSYAVPVYDFFNDNNIYIK